MKAAAAPLSDEDIPTAVKRFRRSVERSIAGLAVTAFLALVSTGEVPAIATVVVLALMTLVIAARRSVAALLDKVGPTLLSLVVALLCGVVTFSGYIIEGLLALVLWLLLIRMAIPRRPRDLFQAIVLTFVMVVGASALTESVEFALPFFAYSAMLVVATTITTAYRAFLTANPDVAPVPAPAPAAAILSLAHLAAPLPRRPRHLRRHWVATSTCLILVCATLFLLIPRFSAPGLWLSALRQQDDEQTSGFDEEVRFGELTNIGLDRTLVMRVTREAGRNPGYVRLRGTALDYFGDGAWRRTTEVRATGNFAEEFIDISRRLMIAVPQRDDKEEEGRWLIEVELNRTNHLFVPYAVSWIDWYLDSQWQYLESDPIAASIKVVDREKRSQLRYSTGFRQLGESSQYADLFRPGAPTLQESLEDRSSEVADRRSRQLLSTIRLIRSKNLQLPEQIRQDRRVAALAREMSDGATDRLTIALRLEHALQTRYSYSLTSQVADRGRVVQEFLFDTRQGHCEHFATAMAMLLRSIDIPARIVNGYYSDEFNPVNDAFMVRESNAHSWVEVWFEEVGWLPFDPTPAGGRGSRRDERTLVERWFSHLYDSTKTLWYRYVIDFSYGRQREIFGRLYGLLDPRSYTSSGLFRLQSFRSRGGQRVEMSPGAVGVLLMLLLAATWTSTRVVLRLRRLLSWRPRRHRLGTTMASRWEPSRLIRLVRRETTRRFGLEQNWQARSLRELLARWTEEGLDVGLAARARDTFEQWRYAPPSSAASPAAGPASPPAPGNDIALLAAELRSAFRRLPRRP
jgi:transglutaminase-like putative cysteine protease